MAAIDGRNWTWPAGNHSLVVEPTAATDHGVTVCVYDETGDGPGVVLTTAQARSVAAALLARADLLDGGSADAARGAR
jgi:hypothetical protein